MPRPRLRWLVLAGALLGCVSQDPDDVFFYVARVTDVGGTPRAGAAASLWQLSSYNCSPTDRRSMVPTATGEELGPAYQRIRDLAANDEGVFYADLMRFEIAPNEGAARCFAFLVEGAGGALTRSAVHGESKDIDFPNLNVWDGVALSVEPGPPARVALPALPWAPTPPVQPGEPTPEGRHVGYDWVLTQGTGELLWHQLTSADPLALAPELLEDFPSPRAWLQAWIDDEVTHGGLFGTFDTTFFHTMVQSPGASISAPGVVPASRGASCSCNGQSLPGCFLTDGSLELKPLPTGLPTPENPTPPPNPDQIILELSRPIVPRLLVVRDLHGVYAGASMVLTLEGSADGSTWLPLAEPGFSYEPTPGLPYFSENVGSGYHFTVPLDSGGQAIQQVRITAANGIALLAAREISVFE